MNTESFLQAEGPHGPVLHSPSRGAREGLYRGRRNAYGVIVHTTGLGPWRRWQEDRDRFDGPFEAGLFVYRHLTKNGPHFVVCGETGRVAQTCPLGQAAWHTGSRGSWRYKAPRWAGRVPRWWAERWPELKGPADLLDGRLWQVAGANQLAVGVEVTPPYGHPRAAWEEPAWQSLRWLTQLLAGVYRFPVDHYHVFTHSDAHPRARTKQGRPWDPGANQWPGRDAVDVLRALPNV